MPYSRLKAPLLVGLLLGTTLGLDGVASQQRRDAAPADVPPVSMTCPMHPDVVESTPGSCPICRMSLVPVRLESIWTCPVHAVVAESGAGICPICKRTLIQMTVALTWTCADHPEIDKIDRGTCPDGKPMVAKRTLRPHGNHNPQHGGQFFMAPDNTHHLEGAHPGARVFRLYVYDDYARPLSADKVKRIKARVVTSETWNAATRTANEIAAFPLKTRGAGYLEGRIGQTSLPAQMTAKVQFQDDGPEYRFDFTFPALTKEPPLPSATAANRAKAPARPSAAPPVANVSTTAASAAAADPVAAALQATTSSAIDPSQISLPIPDTTDGIVTQLATGTKQIGELIERGEFGAVWVPAFQARDLAIALEARLDSLAPTKREVAEPAIKRLVRTAWLLDAFGDVGNRQQIVDAYAIFGSAVADVALAFSK